MKASMIIGKKQIILASLVLVLAAAVYVNWIFSKSDSEDYDITAQLESSTVTETETLALSSDEDAKQTANEVSSGEQSGASEEDAASQNKTLGESELVDSRSVSAEDYFALAAIARLQARDEAIDAISLVLNDEEADSEAKTAASDKALALSEDIENEMSIENLIKSKGFEKCMVYLNGDAANVVVKCSDMDSQKATQIKELVLTESNILAENISIIDLK